MSITPAAYKEICSRPNVFRRSVLERTAEAIRPLSRRESVLVRRQLWSPVVEKPPLHAGGAENDHLILDLASDQIEEVILALFAQMLRCEVEGETHPQELDQIIDLWLYWDVYGSLFDRP